MVASVAAGWAQPECCNRIRCPPLERVRDGPKIELDGGRDRRPARVAAAAMIADLELDHWQHRATRTLSLGNRQRLGIAMALVHRPDVLVLDEPSNSLDPLGVVRIRELLRTRASEDGVSVLVSSV